MEKLSIWALEIRRISSPDTEVLVEEGSLDFGGVFISIQSS